MKTKIQHIIFENISPQGGVIFIKGKPDQSGNFKLYATYVKNTLNLDRKKINGEQGKSANMAITNGDYYRIAEVDGQLKPLKVYWKNASNIEQELNIKGNNIVLNDNKTPLHYDSIKIKNIPIATRELSDSIKSLSNISL